MMGIDELAYSPLQCLPRLSVCYADVAHHPFHQLWNGYSPFCPCDHVELETTEELHLVEPTFEGKPFEKE